MILEGLEGIIKCPASDSGETCPFKFGIVDKMSVADQQAMLDLADERPQSDEKKLVWGDIPVSVYKPLVSLMVRDKLVGVMCSGEIGDKCRTSDPAVRALGIMTSSFLVAADVILGAPNRIKSNLS